MSAFIKTANPFNLAVPPAWFLRALAAYDRELRIWPSLSEMVYRIGRRAQRGSGLMRVLKNFPDSTVCVEHRVWPWKSVTPMAAQGGAWLGVLQDLAEHDTHRVAKRPDDPTDGRVADVLDEREARADAQMRRDEHDELVQISKAVYRSYGLIEGSRTGAGGRTGRGESQFQSRAPRRRAHRPRATGPHGGWFGSRRATHPARNDGPSLWLPPS